MAEDRVDRRLHSAAAVEYHRLDLQDHKDPLVNQDRTDNPVDQDFQELMPNLASLSNRLNLASSASIHKTVSPDPKDHPVQPDNRANPVRMDHRQFRACLDHLDLLDPTDHQDKPDWKASLVFPDSSTKASHKWDQQDHKDLMDSQVRMDNRVKEDRRANQASRDNPESQEHLELPVNRELAARRAKTVARDRTAAATIARLHAQLRATKRSYRNWSSSGICDRFSCYGLLGYFRQIFQYSFYEFEL